MPAGLTRSEAKRDVRETTTCCAYREYPRIRMYCNIAKPAVNKDTLQAVANKDNYVRVAR